MNHSLDAVLVGDSLAHLMFAELDETHSFAAKEDEVIHEGAEESIAR